MLYPGVSMYDTQAIFAHPHGGNLETSHHLQELSARLDAGLFNLGDHNVMKLSHFIVLSGHNVKINGYPVRDVLINQCDSGETYFQRRVKPIRFHTDPFKNHLPHRFIKIVGNIGDFHPSLEGSIFVILGLDLKIELLRLQVLAVTHLIPGSDLIVMLAVKQ